MHTGGLCRICNLQEIIDCKVVAGESVARQQQRWNNKLVQESRWKGGTRDRHRD